MRLLTVTTRSRIYVVLLREDCTAAFRLICFIASSKSRSASAITASERDRTRAIAPSLLSPSSILLGACQSCTSSIVFGMGGFNNAHYISHVGSDPRQF